MFDLTPVGRLAGPLCAAMCVMFSSSAMASGNHADGHGHPQHSAIGQPGVAAAVERTIAITMDDAMRFTPAVIRVRRGETVRFVLANHGQARHEWTLGTRAELLEHLELMKKFPNMEHDEPGKLSLAPGQKGEVIWRFTHAGTVHFACLLPGHYEAGMQGQVHVASKRGVAASK